MRRGTRQNETQKRRRDPAKQRETRAKRGKRVGAERETAQLRARHVERRRAFSRVNSDWRPHHRKPLRSKTSLLTAERDAAAEANSLRVAALEKTLQTKRDAIRNMAEREHQLEEERKRARRTLQELRFRLSEAQMYNEAKLPMNTVVREMMDGKT